MFKMTRWFIWGLFSLLLLTAIDQVLLRVDLPVPGYAEVHEFYVDFRSRLLGLTGNDPVARTISANRQPSARVKSAAPKTSAPTAKTQPRYLYVDTDGALQFADSLGEVPLQYRRDAQPLSE
jgi:hypothetical protein